MSVNKESVPTVLANPLVIPSWKQWFYKNENTLLGFLGIFLALSIWELIGRSGMINPLFISAPSQVFLAGVEYISGGTAWRDVKVSGYEFISGFSLAIVFGIPFGIVMGWYKKINALLDPIISFLYAAPRIALMPIFIIWFGIDAASKVAIIFMGAVFPVIINTIVGIKTIDPVLLNVAKSHKATDFQIFRTIVLPGTVPSIISGVRLGLGHALIGIVVGEMVAANQGLGHMMHLAGTNFRTDLVFFILFVIAGCGVLFTNLLRRVERKFDKWRPELNR